jgi:hypothetical protein
MISEAAMLADRSFSSAFCEYVRARLSASFYWLKNMNVERLSMINRMNKIIRAICNP